MLTLFNLLKKILFLKKKTVWYYSEENLDRVTDGSVILDDFGRLKNDKSSPEWKKLEDNLWRSPDGQEVKNYDLVMPFAVIKPY